jgi:hypothetical protein
MRLSYLKHIDRTPYAVRLLVFGALVSVLASACASHARADQATSAALLKYQAQVDTAVDKGLAFLAREQMKNGCWARDPNGPNITAITSLCTMAFLAKGHTPGNGPYGENLNRAIDYILGSQKPNGVIVMGEANNGPMYNHCISSLMLSEVSGMVDPARQKRIDEVLSKAMKVILGAQDVRKDASQSGGWRYKQDSNDSDISITGWALMALRSSRNNGAVIPKETIDRGIAFVMRCQKISDGGFAYQPGGDSGWGRTGTALLCLELCGHHRDRSALMAGEWLLKHPPARYGEGEWFSYAVYYGAQAMFQLGDDYWERWAPRMYEVLLRAQKDDGRWPNIGSDQDGGTDYYPTAMAVLAMSVSYRQLPIYQR